MGDQTAHDTNYEHSRQIDNYAPDYATQRTEEYNHTDAGSSSIAAAEQAATARSLLSDVHLSGRGNSPVRQAALLSMQRAYGNRAAQRFVQRSAASSARSTESGDLSDRIQAKAGSGSALDDGVRTRLQDGLGADLSAVRVHTDSEAHSMNQEVSATAFTTGQDIFFSSGSYQPNTDDGMRLLAHEAAHTVQQSRGPVSGTPTAGGVSVSDPTDSFEQAADKAADTVLSGGATTAGSPGAVQRQPTGSQPLPVQRNGGKAPVIDVGPAIEIKVPVEHLGGNVTGTEQIDYLLGDLKTAILNYWSNYSNGIENFDTGMVFSSEQEAEAHYLDATLKGVAKFLFDEMLDKVGEHAAEDLGGPWGKIIKGFKSAIEGWQGEKERAEGAEGEVKISTYIQSLRTGISAPRDKQVKAINDERQELQDKYWQKAKSSSADQGQPKQGGSGSKGQQQQDQEDHGFAVGDAAAFLRELKARVDKFKNATPSIPAFQQQFVEQFSNTNEKVGNKIMNGPMSGTLVLRMQADKAIQANGQDKWSVNKGAGTMKESTDEAWNLATTAPRGERLAGQLKSTLKEQGKKPSESNLPKQIEISGYITDWTQGGESKYYAGTVKFTGSPNYAQFQVAPQHLDLLKEAWANETVREEVLKLDKIEFNSRWG